jgi:hypothetical protein
MHPLLPFSTTQSYPEVQQEFTVLGMAWGDMSDRQGDGAARPAEEAAASGNDVLAPPDTTNVAAFGDSLMWGQGLSRGGQYSAVIANALPGIFRTRRAVMRADESRSGAQIRARADQRTTFVDRFPAYFANQWSIWAFLQGRDEQPATALYGEVPAPFPTVLGQVDLVSDALGATIDVALVDGGLNDINPEDIVNPEVSSHEYVERWDGQLRSVGHDDVLELLGRVRLKCPNALILYFGSFAPMSYRSDTGEIRAFFKWELDDPIGWYLNEAFGCEDVNAAILEAVTRAVWLQGRWQYWTRQAVVDANSQDAVRGGPGVLFVPSGFTPDNSGFGPKPFLWQHYHPLPATDPAAATREQKCPRADHLAEMETIYTLALAPPSDNQIQKLHDAIDGPTSLRAAMRAYIAQHNLADLVAMDLSLYDEILRIRHTLIASVGHPNGHGAASYADFAIKRIKEHLALRQRILRESVRVEPVPGRETLDQLLTRYNLRRWHMPLAADATHLDVDSLAVRVVTRPGSDQNFFPDVYLILTTDEGNGKTKEREYLLNFPYRTITVRGQGWVSKPYAQFEPGATNRFTVATEGRLRLEQILSSSILIGGDRLQGKKALRGYGQKWRPETVRLEINGQQVAELVLNRRVAIGFGQNLDLRYPVPAPQAPSLQFAPVELKEQPQLGRRIYARRAETPQRPKGA